MEDLPELIDFMLQRLNKSQTTGTSEISREAIEVLKNYSWPGNVRELENVLHSASVLCKGKRILTKDLPETISLNEDPPKDSSFPKINDSFSNNEKSLTEDNLTSKKVSLSDDVPTFGKNSNESNEPTAPSSISAGEAFDIAYGNARLTTDSNLLEVVDKEMIHRALKECNGNQVKASAILGITRATLRKRIDSYNIKY